MGCPLPMLLLLLPPLLAAPPAYMLALPRAVCHLHTHRDLDDALSIQPLGDGRWRVGVHIADVASFVKPNTALDTEARLRGTSV